MRRRVFVIRGFGTKKDSAGQSIDFEQVHTALVAPALKRCDLAGDTTIEVVEPGNIRADMFALIVEADIVVCDITVHNANVFYELGIRHSLRKKHTVLIKGDPSADTTPFDLSTDRYLKYPVANPGAALEALVETLQAGLRSERETDSPVFLMLPTLTEANSAEVKVVPLDFIGEVQRAEAAGDKSLLRVIAEDVNGQRFQWDGLRRVGRAQWSLKDYKGARKSWETIRTAIEGDIEANLALANLYERQFREENREALLEMSNQAIRQVLDAEGTTPSQRAEAYALKGRNLKTLWRGRLAGAADPTAARKQGLDARVLESYQSYRRAFYCDLNAFYPGVAALQMGQVLRLLAALPNWRNLFRGDKTQADRVRQDLEAELPALAHVAAASIRRAREQLPEDERLWADIADADLLFMTLSDEELEADPSVLVQAYRDAIPPNRLFAWDATGGQLELFAQLGYRSEAVQAVMKEFARPVARASQQQERLVVFTGHRIDAAGAPPRFPAAAEQGAFLKITERLQSMVQGLAQNETLTVLASAAPGADILLHEACARLGVRSRLCLPMPRDEIVRQVFTEADRWRGRFFAVVDAHENAVLQMSDGAALPRWLQGRPGIDPWERGNRWVMELAQTWGARRVTLIALWDGQDDGRTGGTAHMVRLAKEMPSFELDVINSRDLLH